MTVFERDVQAINPGINIFPMLARDGKGIEVWCNWIKQMSEAKKQ